MLAFLLLIGIFIANLFKPQRQLEVENFFSGISSISRCGMRRIVRGCAGATAP
jgi:hypothetical protein